MEKLPDLQTLLQYKNPLVIKRFCKQFPEYADQADFIFEDMLKYLWLCQKHALDTANTPHQPELQFTTVMHKEMIIIDEMWHAFILITKSYADFCQQYFGVFLHHIPEAGEEVNENHAVDITQFKRELTLFLSYIYDELGEDTVRRWFAMHT